MSTNLDSLFTPGLVAAQQPTWPGGPEGEPIKAAVAQLKALPPLVFAGECDDLKARIALAAEGKAFWLQGGDCAETFAAATADSIRNRIKTILQMAAVLQYYSSLPVIKVGRMAGQFAKPRSSDFETRGDVKLPAYRGDAVNDIEFTEAARTPDPQRLVRVYNTSAATLNLEQITDASVESVWRQVERIGGDNGWFGSDLLWWARGVLDRFLVGGVGLRRGRRDPDYLRVGESLDFWRVEELEPGRRLKLYAEMVLPGKAWLEFTVTSENGKTKIVQEATFNPRGLGGQLYWYAVSPFHLFVFPTMLRNIVKKAKANA